MKLNQAGVLEEAPCGFDLLGKPPLPFYLDVEVEIGERKGRVEELLVEGDVSQFIGGFEIGEEAIYGCGVAEECAEGVALFKGRSKGVTC